MNSSFFPDHTQIEMRKFNSQLFSEIINYSHSRIYVRFENFEDLFIASYWMCRGLCVSYTHWICERLELISWILSWLLQCVQQTQYIYLHLQRIHVRIFVYSHRNTFWIVFQCVPCQRATHIHMYVYIHTYFY